MCCAVSPRWFLADELASIGELSSQATEFCIQYVRVFAISMPFFGVVMVGAMCMHGVGETVRPFVISVAINIVNVSLSWMLCGADIDFGDSVLVNPFSFDLDVLGIALGSVFGIFIGAVLTLLILFRGIKDLKLKPTSLLPEPSHGMAGDQDRHSQLPRGNGDVDGQHLRSGIHRHDRRKGRPVCRHGLKAASTDLAVAGEGLQGHTSSPCSGSPSVSFRGSRSASQQEPWRVNIWGGQSRHGQEGGVCMCLHRDGVDESDRNRVHHLG